MPIASGTPEVADAPILDEDVDRPVLAVRHDYPPSYELDWHRHSRGQLLYVAEGVAAVHTPYGAWMAPPERAVWTPAGMPHAVRMVGAVSTRTLRIDPARWRSPGDRSQVIEVSPLLRTLLDAATEVTPAYDVHGRDGLLMELLLNEVDRAPHVPLALPFPTSTALAAKCRAFLERPNPHDTINDWSAELGVGRKAFTRAFRRETGMSFAEWRRQACLLTALPRLSSGESVTNVALDLGYESPAAFAAMFKRLVGVAPSHYV
jgi:AraC-like DNA-binding protein/quercetin dioxygenase-like cupin family protein